MEIKEYPLLKSLVYINTSIKQSEAKKLDFMAKYSFPD